MRKVLCLVLLLMASAGLSAQTFTVQANPSSITVYPGEGSVPIQVSVASSSYSGPVTVALSGLPSDITVTPASLTLTPGSSGTLTLNVGIHANDEAVSKQYAGGTTAFPKTVTVVGAVGSTISTSNLNLTVSISNASFTPTQVNLPVVKIDTGGTAITSKTAEIPGTITITSADGTATYLPNDSDSDNTATFHVHGNTTAVMPKKAYNIKLKTSLDLLAAMGYPCPYKKGTTCDKSKSYILLANYDDKTLLRDWTASALANAIPYGGDYLDETPVPDGYSGAIPSPDKTNAPWAPHSMFVELYLNGAYQGNYQLIEKANVDSHRVNITELDEDDTDDVSGGYLMEIDQHKDEAFVFTTPHNVAIGLQDPDFSPDPEVPAQTSYIQNYVTDAENALFSSNFTDPALGWRAYFDEAAAVNFYLVNDIMGNVDGGAFYSSDYLYKEKDNPFLYMGPIWDFDVSSGNTNYQPIVSPTVPWMQSKNPWYPRWFEDPGFKADVVTQFNTLKNKGVFDNWIASISKQAASLEVSQANNFNRWPMLGIRVWPNSEAADSYDDEVAYLTSWLKLRIAYLDSIFNNKTQSTITITPPAGTLYYHQPATLLAQVAASQAPTGSVSFFSGNVLVGTASVDGSGAATLVTSGLQQGTNTVSAVYSGDGNNALSSSAAPTVTVLPPPAPTVTSLAGSVTPVGAGGPATLTVSVVGATGSAAPSGSVTFLSNGKQFGTAALTVAGTASFTTPSLTAGSYSIQASYAGDANYAASVSSIVTITAVVQDFAIGMSPGTGTMKKGQALTAQLTITPIGGFQQQVQLSCSNLPANATCTFSPATVTPDGANPATSTVTIGTSGASSARNQGAASSARSKGGVALAFLGSGILSFGLLFGKSRRYRSYLQCVLFLLLAGAMACVAGCGNSSSDNAPKGDYLITVTASSGSVSKSVNFPLTVQ